MKSDYDKRYFDKWYRHPRHRVKSAAELARQVRFVLYAAEWVLARPVKSVLDIGCGEGNWRAVLHRYRPSLRYTGVDPSEYAIARYGKRRNLRLGSIEQLNELGLEPQYDLVVCCGMLNYVTPAALAPGLASVARLTHGLAYLELFTRKDTTEGDISWPRPQTAGWYGKVLKKCGLTGVGLHCYVSGQQHPIAQLERTL